MMDFAKFKQAVSKQWERMQQHPLYRVNIDKDLLWEKYLAAFPPGTNPKFRERTEHDCSCCRQFVRAVGDAVAVIDGKVVSVWDLVVNDTAYQRVANALADYVHTRGIHEPFLHAERTAGTDKNFEEVTGQAPMRWEHFFVNIAPKYVDRDAASTIGKQRGTFDVLHRSLKTINTADIDTVLELIAQNSLYRGAENKFALTEFRKLKQEYEDLPITTDNSTFCWTVVTGRGLPESVTRIRNTSIGTLLVDLAEGTPLEDAVQAFEVKVAPANYQRTTALVTKGMIDKARATIQELGLTSALERRYAHIDDITVNNVLFADRSARAAMDGDVFDMLAPKASKKSIDKVEEVPIEKFIADILPKAESLEVMFENSQTGNLVSLVAPVDATAKQLFKWPNHFSWSYNGDVADSMKERVKAAGGNVEGDLCCRLAWNNTDDLDFHMEEPNNSDHIYYGTRRRLSRSGGMLDVDANGIDGIRKDPVENIFYASRRTMREGVYTLSVNQFSKRSSADVGFEAEIDYLGTVYRFAHPKPLRDGATVIVARFSYSPIGGVAIIEGLPASEGTATSRTVWGLQTNTFHKVNVVMLSPNQWDDRTVGNKHYFFMLDGCVNEGTARGFYNEFLKAELAPHRKVLELVGAKMQAESSPHQLSGLGFSSTQRNSLLCRVKGAFTRTVKIVF